MFSLVDYSINKINLRLKQIYHFIIKTDTIHNTCAVNTRDKTKTIYHINSIYLHLKTFWQTQTA